MKNNELNKNGPKDGATSKGPNAKAMEASAPPTRYTESGANDKPNAPSPTRGKRTHCARARSGRTVNLDHAGRTDLPRGAFSDSAGRKWAYRGKRARVLVMLATTSGGVTQWDTLPWHTRLGGTIHVLREDGLSIETVREGEFRHARYWLRTPGTLDDGREA